MKTEDVTGLEKHGIGNELCDLGQVTSSLRTSVAYAVTCVVCGPSERMRASGRQGCGMLCMRVDGLHPAGALGAQCHPVARKEGSSTFTFASPPA